jgi:transposase
LEALKEVKFYRPASELQEYRGTLEECFRAHPPATAKEAMERIEQLTGVRRSPDRVRVFLKGLGMECRKVGMVPAKADPARQESFKKTL